MVSIVADKDLGYSLGAVESLTKPVDRQRLLDAVQQLRGRPKVGGMFSLLKMMKISARSLDVR